MVLERWSDALTGYEWKNIVSHLFLLVFSASLTVSPERCLCFSRVGSSTPCRLQKADATVNFKGQIIQ